MMNPVCSILENSVSKESFAKLAVKIKQASDQKDWEGLKELDQIINADIRSAIQTASSEQEKIELAHYLKSIQKIYKLVVDQSTNYRDEVSKELKKLNQDKKAAKLYSDSSKYIS